MRPVLIGVALSVASSASAQERYASEPQRVEYFDVYDVFSVLAFDTGFQPSFNDPVSVRFHITPSGGVVTEMEATSELEWAGTLEHKLTGVPGTGVFEIDATLEIEAEVHLDLIIYEDYIPVWVETVNMYDGMAFDPMLLAGGGSPVTVGVSGAGIVDPLEFALTVITGINLVFAAEVYPELSSTLSGNRIETLGDDGLVVQTLEDTWMNLPLATVPSPELALSSTYVANFDSELSLVIEPTISVDTWIGDFQLISFPIPVALLDSMGERAFEAVDLFHPLPLVGPLPGETDMGEVPTDTLANAPIELTNVGAMPLEGLATIVGSDDFTVFPESLCIPPGGSDGLMVSFDSAGVGDQDVVLEIITNDPLNPVIQIPIFASAYDPNSLEETPTRGTGDLSDGSRNGEDTKSGCGCQATRSGPSGWWVLGLVGLIRRRSSRD
ncbi:MAG: hypothetical protein GWP91_05000 [Rhodobacterales bacterium]|nr:hypothetical protein [Rhodobacterales bacterium]